MKRTLALIALGIDIAICLIAVVGAIVTGHWVMLPGAIIRLVGMCLLGYAALRGHLWATVVIVCLEAMTVLVCVAVLLNSAKDGKSPDAWWAALGIGLLYSAIGTAIGIGLRPKVAGRPLPS